MLSGDEIRSKQTRDTCNDQQHFCLRTQHFQHLTHKMLIVTTMYHFNISAWRCKIPLQHSGGIQALSARPTGFLQCFWRCSFRHMNHKTSPRYDL